MADIPQIEARGSIEPSALPYAPQIQSDGINLGRAVSRATQIFGELALKRKRLNDATELSNLTTDLSLKSAELRHKVQEIPNTEEHVAYFQTNYDELIKERTKEIKSPDVRSAFTIYANRLRESEQLKVREDSYKLFESQQIAAVDDTLMRLEQQAISDVPEVKESAMREARTQLELRTKEGVFLPEYSQKRYERWLDDVERTKKEAKEEARRQAIIEENILKKQQQVVEDAANKELSDAELSRDLNKPLLDKLRNSLSPGKYESWVEKYNTQTDNINKAVDEKKAQLVESELFVESITNNELSTTEGMEAFKDKLAQRVSLGELDTEKAKTLYSDAVAFNQGDPERKLAIGESIASIEKAYNNKVLGEGAEGTVEREKMIRDLKIWSSMNPDKDPVEFVERILTPKKEDYVERIFKEQWWFLGKRKRTPKEMRELIMEETTPKKESTGLFKNLNIKPTLEQFLIEAKKVNPDVSDAELTDYYNSKYGQ